VNLDGEQGPPHQGVMARSIKIIITAILLLASSAACSDEQVKDKVQAQNGQRVASASHLSIIQTGRVTDAARILDAEQLAGISKKLEDLERETGHQMVVVTVPTLDGQNVATFADNLGRQWGIGRSGHDDGVVLLVAPNERKARISVANGLESKLPDALCQQIMRDEMLPSFRNGNLPGGIDAGVTALVGKLM
jgi:uncharacterized protein